MDNVVQGRPDWNSLYELERARAKAAEAEAAKYQSETEYHDFLIGLHGVDKMQKEVELEVSRMKLDTMVMAKNEEMAQDRFNHCYIFNAPITPPNVNHCMARLTTWNRLDGEEKQPIEMIINSPGGLIVEGVALYDYMRYLSKEGHHITTKTYGAAASMAAVILQAGDKRVMGKESWMLIHQGSMKAEGSWGDLVDAYNFGSQVQDRLIGVFTRRSKLSKEDVEKNWSRKDWWLNSDEALKLGLVDEVE